MNFLTQDDIRQGIKDPFLIAISDDDDTVKINSESIAIAKIKAALNNSYDTKNIFNKTGNDRNALIVHHVLIIFIYLLYQRFDPRKIPEHRKDNYNETLDFLDDIVNNKITLDLPKKDKDTNIDTVIFTAPEKRDFNL